MNDPKTNELVRLYAQNLARDSQLPRGAVVSITESNRTTRVFWVGSGGLKMALASEWKHQRVRYGDHN